MSMAGTDTQPPAAPTSCPTGHIHTATSAGRVHAVPRRPPLPARRAARPAVIRRGAVRRPAARASGASGESGDQMTDDGVGAVDDDALPAPVVPEGQVYIEE